MRARRDELVAHVGGRPNGVQRRLIENAVWLSLKLELMNEKLVEGEMFKARDHNHYLAWSNALRRILALLGLQGTTPAPKTLADVLGEADAALGDDHSGLAA